MKGRKYKNKMYRAVYILNSCLNKKVNVLLLCFDLLLPWLVTYLIVLKVCWPILFNICNCCLSVTALFLLLFPRCEKNN